MSTPSSLPPEHRRPIRPGLRNRATVRIADPRTPRAGTSAGPTAPEAAEAGPDATATAPARSRHPEPRRAPARPARPARPSPRRPLFAAGLALLIGLGGASAAPSRAQVVVFDPRNHIENALQAARQVDSLANEARMLLNQARALAASPYSHLGETSAVLADLSALASEVRGLAGTAGDLERQFEALYPAAVEGLSPDRALDQAQGRAETARETARDLAATAARLDALSAGRDRRVAGALAASEAAEGETAAIQSSTQLLAVLSEDLAMLRTLMLAQSRLMAEAAARESAERAASAEARRRFWARDAEAPSAPRFDPFARARQ
ncbi:conjugal transfer protein TrbJ [Brevundimonas bacteroides]|uniref:conjugal transfer protein TrbJ n=1 Tax=Brevundimonas bacteroides TaxID=74311 RepID=UPI001FE18A58|nr:conjugal transfer protein TrbJ [Brevundimonas bacteroides]